MVDEKERELEELIEEIEIILSVKDDISHGEISNLVNKFSLLSEYDIRRKIEELTGDHTYVQEFINKVNEETSNVPINQQKKQNNTYDLNLYIEKESDRALEGEKKEEIDKSNPSSEIDDYKQSWGESPRKIIFDDDNIPEVSFIKAEIKYGQLSFEWGWPEGIYNVLLCYRMDKYPLGITDSSASQISVSRKDDLKNGVYTIQKVLEGNYYFAIYTFVEQEGRRVFSSGQRRLVVNKAPSEIFYEIKMKKSLFGKLKGVELILYTKSKEVNLPQFVLIGRLSNIPLQKSDGEEIFTTDYQTLIKDQEINIDLPIENIERNMYVKLFFLDDSNSKVYRIVSPAKEKLRIK